MILETMRSRRSIRRFKPDKPSRKCITRLIEAAVTAPSASNNQPWRFFVTEDQETIHRMEQVVQSAVDRIAEHVDPDFMGMFREYGDYFVRFRGAPVVIAPVCKEQPTLSHIIDAGIAGGLKENIAAMESTSAILSASLAIQNLMLYAHSTGLGTSCMTGPVVARHELREILGVPDSWHIIALIPVGYPDESPAPTSRKRADRVIRWVEKDRGGAR